MSQQATPATPPGPGADAETVGHSAQVIRVARVSCSLVMLLTYSQLSRTTAAADAAGIALLVHMALSLAFILIVKRWWWIDPRLAQVETLLDLIAISVALEVTGAVDSPFLIFGVPLFISALLRWGWREAAVTALIFASVFILSGLVDWRAGGLAYVDDGGIFPRVGGFAVLAVTAAWLGRHPRVRRMPNAHIRPDDPQGMRTLLSELGRMLGARAVTLATVHDRGPITIHSTDPELDGSTADFTPEQLLALTRPFLFQLDPPRKVIDRGRLFGAGALSRRVRARALLASLNGDCGLVAPINVQDVRGIVLVSRVGHMRIDLLDIAPWIGGQVATMWLDEFRFRSLRREALMEAQLHAAQDVHDTVVQTLAGTLFRLQALKSWIRAGRDPIVEIGRLAEDVRNAQNHVRDYIGNLRSDHKMDEVCDLRTELERAAQMASRTWTIDCHVVAASGHVTASAWFCHELSLLVIEAVSNAARHGGASEVAIELSPQHGMIELAIQDNGRGFPAARRAPAMPWSINRRVNALGGTLTLRSSRGTRIVIRIPLEAQDDEA